MKRTYVLIASIGALITVIGIGTTVCFAVIRLKSTNSTPSTHKKENQVSISNEVVTIVKTYVRTRKQWTDETYDIDPNAKTNADGHLLVTVVHHDDRKRNRPGGGKSIQLEIDLKELRVVRELGFQ